MSSSCLKADRAASDSGVSPAPWEGSVGRVVVGRSRSVESLVGGTEPASDDVDLTPSLAVSSVILRLLESCVDTLSNEVKGLEIFVAADKAVFAYC